MQATISQITPVPSVLEISRVVDGLNLLYNRGATGVIAHKDQIMVCGAKDELSKLDRMFLSDKGFYKIQEGWAIDV